MKRNQRSAGVVAAAIAMGVSVVGCRSPESPTPPVSSSETPSQPGAAGEAPAPPAAPAQQAAVRFAVVPVAEGAEAVKRSPDGSYAFTAEPVVTDADIAEARPMTYEGPPQEIRLLIRLTPEGTARFAAATREAIGKRLAIVVDGVVTSAPRVQGTMNGGSIGVTVPGTPAEQEAEVRRLATELDPRTRAGTR